MDKAAPERVYAADRSLQRFPGSADSPVVIGGSPLRLFRLTPAGADLLDRITDCRPVMPSRLVDALLDAGAIHPVVTDPTRHAATDVTIVMPVYRAGGAHRIAQQAATSPYGAVTPASIDIVPVPESAVPESAVPESAAPESAAPGPAALPASTATYDATHRVIVDDGSLPPIEHATIRLDRNRGPAAARNAGLAAVTTTLVAFVDADVELPSGWLDPLLAHFDDPLVALVAPRVGSTPGATPLAGYEAGHSPLDLGPDPARVRAGTRVSYVPGAAVVCRVESLRSVGGFDETLRFGEDVDLVWRLDAAGWRCRYEPASIVWHAPRPNWPALWRQRAGYGSSAAPLAIRHPGALAPVRTNAWSVAIWAMSAVGHPIAGAAVSAATGAALTRRLPDLPPAAAWTLAWRGNAAAGGQIASAIRRVWWPLVVLAAIRSRTARRAVMGALLAARSPIRAADDLAYSIGVWRGIVRHRTAAPIIPSISAWPGRGSRDL